MEIGKVRGVNRSSIEPRGFAFARSRRPRGLSHLNTIYESCYYDKFQFRLSPSLVGSPSIYAQILYYNKIILLKTPKPAVYHTSQTQLPRRIMQPESVYLTMSSFTYLVLILGDLTNSLGLAPSTTIYNDWLVTGKFIVTSSKKWAIHIGI